MWGEMAIPESQLETWSHQGAVKTAKATADSIKYAVSVYDDWPEDIRFEVYLQGSYKNATNIRGDSDVDVVVQLNSTFYSNLSEEEKRQLGLIPADYGWSEFRKDILRALRSYYGSSLVAEGNKSIKIKADSGRLPADVVVCAQYRKYHELGHYAYVEGMCFWTRDDNRQVINYPKKHYENGVDKNRNTDGWYKPSVRMFKNIRTFLIDKGIILSNTAPSYFLECLIYNIPNDKFGSGYQDTFVNIVNFLYSSDLNDFVCQNEQLMLFGLTPEQWSINEANEFIAGLISLWNNW